MSGQEQATERQGKGLATGTIGLTGSVIIGLASTAPVYSLVATLGWIVLAVGAQAPIAFVLAFIPMFLVAFAYQELNRAVPDCGTTFTWATKAFGPRVGWMGGWGVAVAGMVVLANLAEVGGRYLWLLVSPEMAENTVVVTITGIVFIAIMSVVSYRGMEIGEKLQNVLLAIQYLALTLFVVFVVVAFATGTAPENATLPTWDWFNPFAFESYQGFSQAILLALFIYWGWDTCLSLNEETKDPARIPGRAALISTVILMFTYVAVAVAAMAYAGLGTTGMGLGNEANADDIFLALKDAVLGPWAWFLVVAVMISAVSSTQTTILPTARGTLAMAAYKALPARFGTVHPEYKTPGFSTTVMGVVASVYYVAMTLVSENILLDSIASLGLAIAFYYAITAFACVWYFKNELFTSGSNLVRKGVIPLIGGLSLTWAFFQSAYDMLDVDYGYTTLFGIGGTFVIGVGSLALGIVLMLLWYMTKASRLFFAGESLNRETEVLVPESGEPIIRSVDGGI